MIPITTIATYASQLAGRPVAIVCEPPNASPQFSGWVYFSDETTPIPVIHLRAGICVRLEQSQTSPALIPDDFLVLAHEAEHIALASLDECRVERTALQNIWQLVRQFKLAAWRAQVILTGVVDDDAAMPSAYRPDKTGAC